MDLSFSGFPLHRLINDSHSAGESRPTDNIQATSPTQDDASIGDDDFRTRSCAGFGERWRTRFGDDLGDDGQRVRCEVQEAASSQALPMAFCDDAS